LPDLCLNADIGRSLIVCRWLYVVESHFVESHVVENKVAHNFEVVVDFNAGVSTLAMV